MRVLQQELPAGMQLRTVSDQPLAVTRSVDEFVKVLECIKTTLLASMNGYPPQLAVEFGRKVLFSAVRPTFGELEEHVRQAKSATTGKA